MDTSSDVAAVPTSEALRCVYCHRAEALPVVDPFVVVRASDDSVTVGFHRSCYLLARSKRLATRGVS